MNCFNSAAGSVCASRLAATGLILGVLLIFILDVAEIYQRDWLKKGGLRLDHVNLQLLVI